MYKRQDIFPRILVNQSAGTRFDGTSEVILAEGRLDIEHFSIGFVVVQPTYPFTIAEGTAGTVGAKSSLIQAEIEAHAMAVSMAGKKWFCPSLESAQQIGATIECRFASKEDLTSVAPEVEGFQIYGVESKSKIKNVKIDGKVVLLELSSPEVKASHVSYAWGMKASGADHKFANFGTLCDDWVEPSLLLPGETLRRYALSGRVAVT